MHDFSFKKWIQKSSLWRNSWWCRLTFDYITDICFSIIWLKKKSVLNNKGTAHTEHLCRMTWAGYFHFEKKMSQAVCLSLGQATFGQIGKPNLVFGPPQQPVLHSGHLRCLQVIPAILVCGQMIANPPATFESCSKSCGSLTFFFFSLHFPK